MKSRVQSLCKELQAIGRDLKSNLFKSRWADIKEGLIGSFLHLASTSALLVGFDYLLKFLREWVRSGDYFFAGSAISVANPFPFALSGNPITGTIYDLLSPCFMLMAVLMPVELLQHVTLGASRIMAVTLLFSTTAIGYAYFNEFHDSNPVIAHYYVLLFTLIYLAAAIIYARQLRKSQPGFSQKESI